MPTIKPRIPFLLHCLDDKQNGASLWKNSTFQEFFAGVDPTLYPFEGLWPEDDASLPRNLSRTESNGIKHFVQALKTKSVTEVVEWRRFQRDSTRDEHSPGRRATTVFFERLMKMGRISEKLDRMLLEKKYHPAALESRNLLTDLDENRGNLRTYFAETLWGPEAMDDVMNVMRREYISVTDAFIAASWGRLRRKAEVWKKNWQKKLTDMDKAWEGLQEQGLTKASIRKAMKSCNVLMEQAAAMHDDMVLNKAGEYLAQLQCVMDKLKKDGLTATTTMTTATCKASKTSDYFATEEEISAVLAEYYDRFHTEHPTPQLVRDLPEISGDEACLQPFVTLQEKELWVLLGLDFTTGQVPFFNQFLSHSRGSQSEDPEAFQDCRGKDQLPEGFEPCRLRWAQLVAIAAMIQMWVQDDDSLSRRSLLLADEVGVGKTGTVMGAIAVYIHARKLYESKSPLPPIFRKHCRWGTADGLPDAPWLILCPASLVANWIAEFKRFFRRGSIRLFTYTGTYASHKDFWTDENEWLKESVNLGNYQKVVICSTSALASDASATLDLHKSISPVSRPRRVRQQSGTLFHIQWAGVAFDEAHELRTRNVKFEAMMNIRERAHSLVLATATPLFTGPPDLLNLQRVTGLGEYGALADKMEKDHRKAINAQKRQNERDRRSGELKAEEARAALNKISQLHVEEIKKQFHGRIIRRTPESPKWDGTPLLSLPTLHHHAAFITLSEKEMHELDQIRKEANSGDNSTEFTTRAFYTRYRTTISHYMLSKGDSFALPKTLEDWKGMESTKFNNVVKLVDYILQDDDSPKDFAEESTGEFRLPTYQPPPDAKKTDKVVIYQEYMSHAPLLKRVFELNGIQVLLMNGSVGMKERERVMKTFNATDHPRVLLISKVGTTGLNMAKANHIVIVDSQWAEQENKQAVGRVWRYPQKKPVHAYYLSARNTTDGMIGQVAGLKGMLLGMFLDNDIPSPLAQFLDENHTLSEDEANIALNRVIEDERAQDDVDSREEQAERVKKRRPKMKRDGKEGATDKPHRDDSVHKSRAKNGEESDKKFKDKGKDKEEQRGSPLPHQAESDGNKDLEERGTKRKHSIQTDEREAGSAVRQDVQESTSPEPKRQNKGKTRVEIEFLKPAAGHDTRVDNDMNHEALLGDGDEMMNVWKEVPSTEDPPVEDEPVASTSTAAGTLLHPMRSKAIIETVASSSALRMSKPRPRPIGVAAKATGKSLFPAAPPNSAPPNNVPSFRGGDGLKSSGGNPYRISSNSRNTNDAIANTRRDFFNNLANKMKK